MLTGEFKNMSKEDIIKRIKNVIDGFKSGDGCSCHINPPCGYCTDDTNSLIGEIADCVDSELNKLL